MNSPALRNMRLIALQFALVAMVMRALLPAGWMPNPTGVEGGTPFVLCSTQGAVTIQIGPDGQPVKPSPIHNHGQAHDNALCSFASAAHLAPPASFTVLPAHPIIFTDQFYDRLSEIPQPAHRLGPNAARAPPTLA